MIEQATVDLLLENDNKMLELVLQLTNTYLDMHAKNIQQKRVISMQGSLINQCMERIMQLESCTGIAPHNVYKIAEQLAKRIETLEGRSVILSTTQDFGKLEQKVEALEANQGKFYGLNDRQSIRMTKQLIKRVEELESWLYTHDYGYFQEQERKQQSIADNAQLEGHGTHPPDCRCPWCDPEEGVIKHEIL